MALVFILSLVSPTLEQDPKTVKKKPAMASLTADNLPEGWRVEVIERKDGKSKGKPDKYSPSPRNKKA